MTSYPGAHGTNLVDLLDRVLDKGLVVAGDIKISLANVELLTIRIRLLVCSIDKAEQIGLNWWRYDQSLVRLPDDTDARRAERLADAEMISRLEARIAELEARLATSEQPASLTAAARRRGSSRTSRQSQPRQGGGAAERQDPGD